MLSPILWAQQPPMFNFTPTNSSGTFYGQAQVGGIAASANDWIAAFDASGNCAGASVLTINSGVAYINLVIYGDDATTPSADEGMSGSEDFTLKLYQQSSGQYLDYPSTSNISYFSAWTNTNGAPMPTYDDVTVIYNFAISSVVSLNLTSTLCENESAIILNGGQPSGGMYYGSGVTNGTFDPALAGGGNHVISYVLNGDSAFDTILVYTLADATLLSTGPYCDNESSVTLNSVTTGGTYSGSGVMNNTFNPDVVGVGSYWISYILTDNNSCTQNVETLVEVNVSPPVPTITQNGNALDCNGITTSYQWYDDNMIAINGANAQQFTPLSSGSYYVEVSNIFCSELSDIFQFALTDVKQVEWGLLINTNNNILSINSEHFISQLQLFDISGKEIFYKTSFLNTEIDVNNISSGIYFLNLKIKEQIICKKVIL